MQSFLNLHFTSKQNTRINGLCFELLGKGLKPSSHIIYSLDGINTEDYLVLRYRALDIMRTTTENQPLLLGVQGEETTTLCFANDMIFDHQAHLLIVPCQKAHYDSIRFRLPRRAPRAEFEIIEFYTCFEKELPARFPSEEVSKDGYRLIDLRPLCNSALPKDIGVTDGGKFPIGNCGILGIPFDFAPKMIRPCPGPASNEDIISNFGVPAKRRDCRPESRESRFTVPIGGHAKEFYFALVIDGEATERCGFRKMQSAILGGTVKKPVLMPLAAKDIERFAVIIKYADGREDECFPVSLETGKHIVSGRLGLYGVWADGEVESISFENRILDTDISLCALTVNEAAPRIIADPFASKRKIAPKGFDLKPSVTLSGDLLTLQNGGMELVLDTANGLQIVSLKNAFIEKLQIGGSLLQIRFGEELITHFERKAITVNDSARITYAWGDLWITVSLAPTHTDGFTLSMSAKNTGNQELSCGILFPALNNVQFADEKDTWYFLPKYQNLESNETCFFYEESAPSYPLQFFDLFSQTQGGGIAVCTREREQTVRKYGFQKQKGFIQAFIEYPDIYMNIAPGETFYGSETVFYSHSGDWKAAFAEYKGWLDSWYVPYKCQHRDWYRQLFWLIAEITDYIDKPEISKFPVWYDKEKKEHHFERILNEQAELYGAMPDILHLWGWTWSEEYKHMLWGNFGGDDYEIEGGLEAFRNALESASKKTGAQISLYLHPTLLSEAYPELEQYKHLLVKNERGKYLGLGNTLKDTFANDPANENHVDSFRMCHANKDWRRRILDMYPRVIKKPA